MRAAYAKSFDATDPLAGLVVGDIDEPEAPEGWIRVSVQAASINHHDLWTLRGVVIPSQRLPMILGTDAAGVLDDGTRVLVHAVIGDPEAGGGDETLDPEFSLLSERHPGTLAEHVWIPATNAVALPDSILLEHAACLPTAWLTAYRMLTRRSGLRVGDTVLVQGAGGGVSTAAIALGEALGFRVWVTSRDENKRAAAMRLGAHDTFAAGARLPERVDAVIETVGAATWPHSLRCLRPGGVVVVSGATTGDPQAELNRMYSRQLSIVGSMMGTRDELMELVALVEGSGILPAIDSRYSFADARAGFARLASGDAVGKVVLLT